MRKKIIATVALTIVGTASVSAMEPDATASNGTAATAASEVAPAPDSDADKVKCKSVRGTTSLIPTRVCKTKAEWAAEDRATRDMVDAERRRSDRSQGS